MRMKEEVHTKERHTAKSATQRVGALLLVKEGQKEVQLYLSPNYSSLCLTVQSLPRALRTI